MPLFKDLKNGDRFWWKGAAMVKISPVPSGKVGEFFRCCRFEDKQEAFDLPGDESMSTTGDLYDESITGASPEILLVASKTESRSERETILQAVLDKKAAIR